MDFLEKDTLAFVILSGKVPVWREALIMFVREEINTWRQILATEIGIGPREQDCFGLPMIILSTYSSEAGVALSNVV